VVEAILPLVLLFIIFQLLMLRLPRRYVLNILKGSLLAAVGLLIFLQGVQIAFLPFGRAIGEALARCRTGGFSSPSACSSDSSRLGASRRAHIGRPGGTRIERIDSPVHRALCDLHGRCPDRRSGMLRIGYGIPLLHILIPGYAIVLVIHLVQRSRIPLNRHRCGGRCTGPIANTFLLALALGVSSSLGRQDPMIHGLGLVAMIALAPIISVMVLGFMLAIKKRQMERKARRMTDMTTGESDD